MPKAKYTPVHSGIRTIGESEEMGKVSLEVANRISGNANAVGDSTYKAENRTLPGGWDNEPRAGAAVMETDRHWRDSRDAVLVRVTAAMVIRGAR